VLDRALDVRLSRESQLDREFALQVRAQLVDRDNVGGIGERDRERALGAVQRDREDAKAARELARQHLERERIDDQVRELDGQQPELLRQRVAHRLFGDETQLYQQPPDRKARFRLLDERDPELVVGEQAPLYEDLADLAVHLLDRCRVHRKSLARELPDPLGRALQREIRASRSRELERNPVLLERGDALVQGGRGSPRG
jgi:hypothetical protein